MKFTPTTLAISIALIGSSHSANANTSEPIVDLGTITVSVTREAGKYWLLENKGVQGQVMWVKGSGDVEIPVTNE